MIRFQSVCVLLSLALSITAAKADSEPKDSSDLGSVSGSFSSRSFDQNATLDSYEPLTKSLAVRKFVVALRASKPKDGDVGYVIDKDSGQQFVDEITRKCTDADCFQKALKALAVTGASQLEAGYAQLDPTIRGSLLTLCNRRDPVRTQCMVRELGGLVDQIDALQGTCLTSISTHLASGQVGEPKGKDLQYTRQVENSPGSKTDLGKILKSMCKGQDDRETCYREKSAELRNQFGNGMNLLGAAAFSMTKFSVQSLACESGESAVVGLDKADPKSPKANEAFPGFGAAACQTRAIAKTFTDVSPLEVKFKPSTKAYPSLQTCLPPSAPKAAVLQTIRFPAELEMTRTNSVLEDISKTEGDISTRVIDMNAQIRKLELNAEFEHYLKDQTGKAEAN